MAHVPLALAAILAGCGPPTPVTTTPPDAVAVIGQVVLELIPPTVLNWDDRPGADGVRVRLFFVPPGQDLPALVRGGVDVMLYEEPSAAVSVDGERVPWHTWSFNAQELSRFSGRTMFGWGYTFPLGWGDRVPRSPKIMLRARYRPPRGRPVQSAPVTIPMVEK